MKTSLNKRKRLMLKIVKYGIPVLATLLLTSLAYSGTIFYPKKGSFHLEGGITSHTIPPLLKSIKERAKTSKQVWLIIDSPGGNIEPAITLVRLMSKLQQRGVKFKCVVTGAAKSAAFYVFSMCDTRYALKLSRLLYHDGSVSLFGVTLSEADMVAMGIDFTFMNHRINKDIRKALGFSKRRYDRYKEVTWFPANLQAASPGFLTIVHDYREAK